MDDKPISLSKARKARARAEKRAKADANSAKFGRTKAQKTREADTEARVTKLWSDHKRED
ncbi:MAG: DUF4169 family protein [Pseudomonadota bacterium]